MVINYYVYISAIPSAEKLYGRRGADFGFIVYDSLPSSFVPDETSEGCHYVISDGSWKHTKYRKRKLYTYRGVNVVFGVPPEGVLLTTPALYCVPIGTTITTTWNGNKYIFGSDSYVQWSRNSGTNVTLYPHTYKYTRHQIIINEPPKSLWASDYGYTLYNDYVDRRIGWDPGALTAKAVSSAQGLSINSLQYLREIPSVGSTIVEMAKGINALRHGDVKGIANAFLSGKYGTSNTVRDTVDIAKYLYQGRSTSGTHMHASGNGGVSGSNFAITYKDTMSAYAVPACSSLPSQVVDGLRDTDLLPSLKNLWDVVPYSFVIDWVLPIGEILSSVDASMDLLRYDFAQCYYSRIVEFTTRDVEYEVSITHYQRWSSAPVLPVGISSYSTAQGNHFLEASALLVQRVHT